MRVLVPFGTRPEIIKLAPVIRALRDRGFDVRTLATGQHFDPSMTDAFYETLSMEPDTRWQIAGETAAHRLGEILSRALDELAARQPDLVLLLGDTYTVPLFCLAARQQGIPVVHVEAGLRSFNERSTEELNRRIAAVGASLHLAPTPLAAAFLRSEGVPPERIHVVGNPVIDVVRQAGILRRPPEEREGVVLTAHRATNVDDAGRLDLIVRLARRLAEEAGPVTFPVHPRTRARLEETGALPALDVEGLSLVAPLAYGTMLRVVAASRVVVTDSGGLQEEASWLGVPTVILRRSTPRWEGVNAGTSVLVGLDVELAVGTVRRLATVEEGRRVAAVPCPYGDGHAAERIADTLVAAGTAARLRLDEPNWVAEPRRAVRAVLFDLDDTLYPQSSWLEGAWTAVAAEAASRHGVEPVALREALKHEAARGSARTGIIDRALEVIGVSSVPVEPLVAAFRSFEAGTLEPYPGVSDALAALRGKVPIALVSDGDPDVQRAKLAALGLDDCFDAVVLSDELGREFRKPHPAAFQEALAQVSVEAADAVYIGDNPGKDVCGGRSAGLRVIRVRTGEYAGLADDEPPWAVASDAVEAIDLVEPLLAVKVPG